MLYSRLYLPGEKPAGAVKTNADARSRCINYRSRVRYWRQFITISSIIIRVPARSTMKPTGDNYCAKPLARVNERRRTTILLLFGERSN